jgi:hypothetical protein
MSTPEADPDVPPVDVGRKVFWQRLVDSCFGYDFFVSYAWADGRTYAVQLTKKLEAMGFECFLDSAKYAKGDNWKLAGQRALRKTSRLVLVVSPRAHESKPVLREVQIYTARGRRVIPIDFEGTLTTAAPSGSPLLMLIDPDVLRIAENRDRLGIGPSDDALAALRDGFNIERQDRKRAKYFAVAALVFAAIAAVAILFWRVSTYQKHQAQSNLTTSNLLLSRAAGDGNRLATMLSRYFAVYELSADDDPRKTSSRQLIAGWSRLLGPPLVHEGAVAPVPSFSAEFEWDSIGERLESLGRSLCTLGKEATFS